MSEATLTQCQECAGDGECTCCQGNGRILARHLVGECDDCHGYGHTADGLDRIWCPTCGGSGRYLTYGPGLVVCPECIGDGACMGCEGTGTMTAKHGENL